MDKVVHIKNYLRKRVRRAIGMHTLLRLENTVIEINNVIELKKLFNWNRTPIIDDVEFYTFDNVYDLNERRLRDAETIATVVCNINPSLCLDIGTHEGHSAALMSVNAPQAKIYTINIPPEEIHSGEGGVFTSIALERERIGSYYRAKGLGNITQIIANTAKWEPDIGVIDVAFVDGCHDTDFVYNDTKKVLAHAKSGSFILWHDFNPSLWNKYPWIYDVCRGVDLLLDHGLIQGNIYYIRDSWIGIYRVP